MKLNETPGRWLEDIPEVKPIDELDWEDSDKAIESGQSNASSTNAVAPSITTTVANTMLVGSFGCSTAGVRTFTAPVTMTERFDVANATFTACCGDDESYAAAQATGTRTAVISSASANIGHLCALAPLVATFKLSGVTGPAKISGVTASGIAKVTGVAP